MITKATQIVRAVAKRPGEGRVVTTADIVRERSLQLALSHDGSREAVDELLRASGGRRVSLVLAKQQLTEQLGDDTPGGIVHRGLELIAEALRLTEAEG